MTIDISKSIGYDCGTIMGDTEIILANSNNFTGLGAIRLHGDSIGNHKITFPNGKTKDGKSLKVRANEEKIIEVWSFDNEYYLEWN